MDETKYSIIIPAYNEEGNIEPLLKEINEQLKKQHIQAEVIIINDGSTDNTLKRLVEEKKKYTFIKIIDFNAQYGKASALQAGFKTATNDYIFTMDCDLQDDPKEFSNFIKKLSEDNCDMVSGWKYVRHDPLDKTLPSRVANKVMRKLSGVKIHDMNCGFKLYTKRATQALSLYGDMHRFIPAILGAQSFRISEVRVHHRKRHSGKSKFGALRLLTSFFDFLTIILLTKYLQKPLHFFGLWGITFIGISMISLIYLFYIWAFIGEAIGTRPLFTFSLITLSLGIQITLFGLIAELVIRNNPRDMYIIRKIYE